MPDGISSSRPLHRSPCVNFVRAIFIGSSPPIDRGVLQGEQYAKILACTPFPSTLHLVVFFAPLMIGASLAHHYTPRPGARVGYRRCYDDAKIIPSRKRTGFQQNFHGPVKMYSQAIATDNAIQNIGLPFGGQSLFTSVNSGLFTIPCSKMPSWLTGHLPG